MSQPPNDDQYCSGDNFIRNYVGPISYGMRYNNLPSRLHMHPPIMRPPYGKYIINIIEYQVSSIYARD